MLLFISSAYLDVNHIVIFLLIGVVVGFLSGLLGKGGSSISTPALQVFGGVAPLFALASPLPASFTNSLSGSIVYRKEHLINKKVVLLTLLIGIPATVLGSYWSDFVPGDTLMVLTALFVCALGISFLSPLFLDSKKKREQPFLFFISDNWKIVCIAVFVGLLSGLLANSGGILYAPLFIRWLKLPTKEAMASSLLVAGGLAIPGTIVHWILGHIDWWIVLILAISSIPSAYWGAKLNIKMKNESLELIFGLMLCLFGIYDIIYTLYL